MNAALDERYFDWLYGQIVLLKGGHSYRGLTHILFETEFVWFVPNDDNRVEDGRDLRWVFLEDHGLSLSPQDCLWMDLPCSIFELLLGMSKRLSFETDRTTDSWFWELIENLDLHQCHDATTWDSDEIEEILACFMWRNYDADGRGGLFPLEFPEQDQRKVELWYQLNAYILESL